MPFNDNIDNIDNIDDTLVRYFSGQLSDAERVGLEAWILEDPARRAKVERLRTVWEASATAETEPDTEAALAQLKERIGAGRPAAESPRPVLKLDPNSARQPHPAAYVWPAAAAAVVLLIGGGLLWRAVEPRSPVAGQPALARTYATARAERATLTLPDGSTVMLNNESTLEVPVTFSGGARDVYLRGEGFFQVAHDSTRPFRVHTAHAVTQVLGTKFDVRARPDEAGTQVAVIEGRVALGETHADSAYRVVLVRGELGRLGADGRTSVVRGAEADRAHGWTEGRLAFERTPLPDVLAELSRWYDRDFVMADSSLARLRLTTSLRGESITEAIQLLEAALDVKAQVLGRKVVLHR